MKICGIFCIILSLIVINGFQLASRWSGNHPSPLYSSPESSSPSCPFADKCSGEYRSQGCDGSGQIKGGLGAVFEWMPVKVYRPCPSYLAAGYQYKREGQTMDQVLFSEPSTKMKAKIELEARKRAAEASNKVSEEISLTPSQSSSSSNLTFEEEEFIKERFNKK